MYHIFECLFVCIYCVSTTYMNIYHISTSHPVLFSISSQLLYIYTYICNVPRIYISIMRVSIMCLPHECISVMRRLPLAHHFQSFPICYIYIHAYIMYHVLIYLFYVYLLRVYRIYVHLSCVDFPSHTLPIYSPMP